ncbi:HNH endonuclease [Blastococcus sp. VKM Ac-2987]|uniref:HNH endonuclease n=1 Tax=Blastococcus sp. VKM Ac-2987 TaxID=3004141 RepID=UPI003FA426EC
MRKPQRRCLDCWKLTRNGSRCPPCTARRKAIRNADRPIARAVVAAAPVCVCTSDCPWHRGKRTCGATTDLTADHVVPLSQGGTNEGPRRVLCRRCNSRRGAGRY